MMEKIHAEAKTAAYAALTPAHAASVTSIAAQVAAGTLDPRSAEKQIDTLLTTDEQTAVRAAERKAMSDMRSAMEAAGIGPMGGRGGPPMGGGPGGPPPGMGGGPGGPPPGMWGPRTGGPDGGPPPGSGGGGPPPEGGRRFGPAAGRYLLMVSLTPDQMHKLMAPRARSSAAP
jgi:hypothetical protein